MRCDLCLNFKHPFIILGNKRNWNLYFCVCVYFETSFAGKFVSFLTLNLTLFQLIQYWQPYQKTHLHTILLTYYLKMYRILCESNHTFHEFIIEILLHYHCIFATCLLLSWFCLVCSSSEFLYVQLVAVIVYAVCWLALYLWSRWTDWLAGAWIYGLHYSCLLFLCNFMANFC